MYVDVENWFHEKVGIGRGVETEFCFSFACVAASVRYPQWRLLQMAPIGGCLVNRLANSSCIWRL